MYKIIWILFIPLLLNCSRPTNESHKKILIYTHNGEGYVHENINASVKALQEICNDIKVETEVSDDPASFTSENLLRFDAIIFSNTNNEAFLTDDQRDAFQAFIRSGKGFVGIHSACGSERNWPWFWAMLGGKFLRHPPFQPFDIKVIDRNHPSTRFLPDTWKWEDECYFINNLNPDIHVLLAADLSTIKDENLNEYPDSTFGNLFPLAWYHRYDSGREWYTALGHNPEHYSDPLFRKHLKGGIKWSLGMAHSGVKTSRIKSKWRK
jgi:type 1 glutamine amidotransferase